MVFNKLRKMKIKVETTPLEGLLVVEPRIFSDSRGYFFESYNKHDFVEAGININFVQNNESKSEFGVIRGLHYQLEPYAQSKLIRVIRGKIFDVALDIRKNSPTFGKWFGLELSEDNKKQLFVPKGFAHGFSVLSPEAIVLYKCDNYYQPSHERGINFGDPKLNIKWKIAEQQQIVSEKDMKNPTFELAEMNF